MFKVNNNDTRTTPGIVPVSLLLTLNIFHNFTYCSSLSIVYFEQVSVDWDRTISAHLEQFNSYVNLKKYFCKFICDLYVDDLSRVSILALAQFNLLQWETNGIKLKKQIQINKSLDNNDTVPLTENLKENILALIK